VGPVLLLDVGVVILLVGAAPGELDALGLAVPVEMVVDELRAVVRVDPAEAEGQGAADRVQGRLDPRLAAPSTARVSTQVVWMAVAFKEWANSPSARWPAWATRSISVNPGTVTSQ
jgi:hypothetical protein